MKKQFWILSTLILILLVGCGPVGFFEEEQEPRERLNVSEWPTPQPTPAPATATPFPKTTLAPTATPTTAGQSQTTAAPAPAGRLNFSGNITELAQQVSDLTGGLTPVGAAIVSAGNTPLYQGPDDSSEVVDTLGQGTIAALLGKSSDGNWVYVITDTLVQGWLPAGSVNLTGSLADAPVLSPEQVNAVATEANQTMSSLAAGQLSLQEAGLNAVGVAFVTADGIAIRQGPGANYGSLGAMEQGDVAGVFGKNAAGDWIYTVGASLTRGWVPVEAMRVVGDLAAAPVLPNNPIAAAAARLGASVGGGSATGSAGQAQRVDVDSLQAVATARVNNFALNLRQRPGPNYNLLDTLNRNDEVTILGLNRDKQWVLLQTANGQLGWGSVDFLDIDGSLDDAPVLRTTPPGSNYPANQVAPMVAVSGDVATTSVAAAAGVSTEAEPAAAVEETGGPALPTNTLAPVTTGKGLEKVDLRRGPANSYGASGELTVDEAVTALAVNFEKDWVLLQTANSEVGWAPLGVVALEGPLDNAASVLSGWVTSNDLDVRRGPGIYFDTVGKVAINTLVSILAVDQGRSWALVEPLGGGQGWIQLRLLNISGSLDSVPQIAPESIATTTPGEAIPAPGGPPTGKLVLQTSSGGDIMVINADGSGLRQLTNGIDPVLSNSGEQVAFTRWQGDVGTLWVINTDGTGERAILGETRKAKGPAWSPDDSQIVLNFQQGGRLNDKRDCNTLSDGGGASIPRNAKDVSFQRNSEGVPVLCYTLPADPQWSLRVVNVADGSFEDMFGGVYAFRPTWDPNQPWRIVSDSGNGLLAVDVNRDDFRQPLTDSPNDGSPVFSPDGRFIALATNVQGGYDIFRMNSDGSGRVRLTETPLWVPVQPDSNGKQWNNVAPAWSPDGSQIAFLTDRNGRWEIWLMNADGSNQRPMFSDEINAQLDITYNFVDERVISWR